MVLHIPWHSLIEEAASSFPLSSSSWLLWSSVALSFHSVPRARSHKMDYHFSRRHDDDSTTSPSLHLRSPHLFHLFPVPDCLLFATLHRNFLSEFGHYRCRRSFLSGTKALVAPTSGAVRHRISTGRRAFRGGQTNFDSPNCWCQKVRKVDYTVFQ